jgi:hypothetical protein
MFWLETLGEVLNVCWGPGATAPRAEIAPKFAKRLAAWWLGAASGRGWAGTVLGACARALGRMLTACLLPRVRDQSPVRRR